VSASASGPNQSRVLHRNLNDVPPMAVRGQGIYLHDAAGRRYIDACGGAAVSCLGHNHPKVIAAIERQLERLPFAYTGFFTTEPLEALANILTSVAPAPLSKAVFVSGGSEAMEAALKIARQYFVETGQPERQHFISRRLSYHGSTLGALAVSGHVARRATYEPLLMPVQKISPCYAYRGQTEDETTEAYGRRVADELEQAILAHPPNSVAAFVAETVVGATTGCVPAVPGYFKRIREICDQYGVLLILDEVMCGMGRCGWMFAFEEDGIVPDLVTMAKGLGAGFQPIGAVLVTDAIAEAIREGSGYLQHGHTYAGHAVACAGALAVQEVIRDENLLANVGHRGGQLAAGLRGALGELDHVGDIRGRGLFWGVEFVSDRSTKAPFPRAERVTERLQTTAISLGLLCYPGVGTADGRRGDHLIVAPPFNVTPAEVDDIIDLTARAVRAVFAG
jgi:adenosylmethionine-8-amino-7-oxononanoate aminotransferase